MPRAIAARLDQANRNVLPTTPSKKRKTVFEDRGQMHTVGKAPVTERERETGDSIRTNNALIFIDGQKQCGAAIVAWQSGEYPAGKSCMRRTALWSSIDTESRY